MAVAGDDVVDTFVLGLGLGPDVGAFLRSLPEDVKLKVIRNFNPRGTKDGNVFGRLQAFARSMLQPMPGRPAPVAAWPCAAEAAPLQPPEQAMQPQPQPQLQVPEQQHFAAAAPLADVSQYAQAIGLDETGAHFLAALPQDVRDTIVAEFDPRGTKDGNVLGRLLGFARAVWAQRMGLDTFQRQEAATLLRNLPEEAQARVMTQFDFSGTKDGNVLARLQRFAGDVASRYTGGWSATTPMGQMPGAARALPAAAQPVPQQMVPSYGTPATVSTGVAEFVGRLGLDAASASFLYSLPEDVRSVVVTSFNPSGTKDGNVWGRLFGFVRSVWSQRLGLDHSTVEFLKSLPEDTQRVVIVKFDPSRTKDGNIAARLESFARSVASYPHPAARQPALGPPVAAPGAGAAVHHAASWPQQPQAAIPPDPTTALRAFSQRWGLNTQATAFLEALPEAVSAVVVASFNANGTKDGNVWGRLFGFVRSVWAQKLGLDAPAFGCLRGLSEDVQMTVMARFQPQSGQDLVSQLQACAEEVLRTENVAQPEEAWVDNTNTNTNTEQWGAAAAQVAVPQNEQDEMDMFVRRCGLDADAMEFLRGLQPEVKRVVICDFDPGGTKDGNVFGRLQGFVRSIEGRRKRQLDAVQGGRTVRTRWGEEGPHA